jgi:hypothetical protein
MRLRAWGLFWLPAAFALAAALPPALAQLPRCAGLKALKGRVTALHRAGKYGGAIPLAVNLRAISTPIGALMP